MIKLKNFNRIIFLSMVSLFLRHNQSFPQAGKQIIYKDSSQPIELRVKDLLKRMSIEEKIGQMCQYVGIEHIKNAEKMKNIFKDNDANGFYSNLSINKLEELTTKGLTGSFLHVTSGEESNRLQSLALKSKLGIPLLFGIDAIHGTALTTGATVYPTPIGMASTWDTLLIKKIGTETAKEMRSIGMHWTFTPNVDVARDARWGRVGETFGEDPFLVSAFGVAMTDGLQNNGQELSVLACAKHLVGGGQPSNGLNASPLDVSDRQLREIFLPSFKAIIKAGAFTVMAAHNELNGVPCHSNRYLLTDILRHEYGFKGFVVSDWMDIERINSLHKTAETPREASYMAVDAGIDMHMHGPDFFHDILDLYKEGKITEKKIDESVSKILTAKFMLGLFEHPFVDLNKSKKILLNQEHQKTNLTAARESIVLLKNNGILPLNVSKYKKILITGPNANNQTILGDWTLQQPEENVVTIVEGFNKLMNNNKIIEYYDCGQSDIHIENDKIKKAGQKAGEADLTILVVGENSLRYLKNEKTCGENVDRSDIQLPGNQMMLVREIEKSKKPFIVVLINGRPLGIEEINKNAQAVVEAWEPGNLGGLAVAEIILGEINPSGKLPITFPRSVGQIHAIYNYKPSQYFHQYALSKSSPLYEFGYGLSYNNYTYNNIKLSKNQISDSENTNVTVDVTNNGKYTGDEIVQLYIRDEYSSVTRPVKELKGFKRITLKPGETKKIQFEITPDMLAYYDINMKYGVEKGDFIIMVGSSSRNEDLINITLSVK